VSAGAQPELDGHVIAVTGAANGIGAATTELLLERGATVVAMDTDRESLADLGDDPRLVTHVCDVTDEDQLRSTFDQAARQVGVPVSGLVNNAGVAAYFDAVEMTAEQWDRVFAVDLKGVWLTSKHALPHLRSGSSGARSATGPRSASIVNIASIHARLTTAGMFPYAAAKSGVIGLTRSLALDLAPEGIRVNAVSPGWTRTALVQEWFDRQDDGESAERSVLEAHPLRRICEPREVAEVIAFLLDDRASGVTGAEFCVDAGLSARFAA